MDSFTNKDDVDESQEAKRKEEEAANAIFKEMEELTRKIKKFQEKYEGKLELEFKGYADIPNQIATQLPDGTVEIQDEMSAEFKKMLYDAVSSGNLDEVEDLIGMPECDINMTWFSENLLMCAIRNKNEKVAELLINNGIDVSYEVDFKELPEDKSSITVMKQNARQMAYDRGMYSIVRLIDIFDKQTHKKIVKYLGKRCIKEINQQEAPPERPKTTVINYLLSEDGRMLGETLEDEEHLDEKLKSELLIKMYKDVDVTKPKSDFMYVFEEKSENDLMNSQSRSNFSSENLKESMDVKRRIVKGKKDLSKSIKDCMFDPFLTSSQNNMSEPPLSYRSKILKYQDYEIDVLMNNNEIDSKNKNRPIRSGMNFYLNNEYEIKNIIKKDEREKLLKKRLNVKFDSSSSQGSDFVDLGPNINATHLNTNRSHASNSHLNSNRSDILNIPTIFTVPFKSTIVPISEICYSKEKRIFTKKENSFIKPLNKTEIKDKLIEKDVSKLNNHYYLNTLRYKRVATRPVIEECLKQHLEAPFPLENLSQINQQETSNLKKVKGINSKAILSSAKSGKSENSHFKPKLETNNKMSANSKQQKYKTENQIIETYLSSLKKSGLSNKNCLPILKSTITAKRNFIKNE